MVWESPEYDSDKVDFYVVSYGIQDAQKSMALSRRKPTADNNPSLTITNLKPNKVYRFTVRHENAQIKPLIGKESEVSDPIKTSSLSSWKANSLCCDT